MNLIPDTGTKSEQAYLNTNGLFYQSKSSTKALRLPINLYTVVCKSLGTPLRLHHNLLSSQVYNIHFLVNTECWGVFQTNIFSVAIFSCVK